MEPGSSGEDDIWKENDKFRCYPHESYVCVCREVTGVKIMHVMSLLPLCRNADLILGI